MGIDEFKNAIEAVKKSNDNMVHFIESEKAKKKIINGKYLEKLEEVLLEQSSINRNMSNQLLTLMNQDVQGKLVGLEENVGALAKTISAADEKALELEENISKNKELIFEVKSFLEKLNEESMKRLENVEENVRNNNHMISEINMVLDKLKENIVNIELNLQSSNKDLEYIKESMEKFEVQIKLLDRKRENNNVVSATEMEINNQFSQKEDRYEKIDYFDFENHFRGSRASIKRVQEQYVKYFINKTNVLDLGCGRGEFLELLKDNGVDAKGIDLYPQFVEYCKMKSLEVYEGDAIEYLSKADKVGGIFAGQLVEHLEINQIITLCELAFEKLEEGGYIILETPNPQSLAIYVNAFYLDPSHLKPVHPLTLQYFMQKAGFNNVEIIYTESSKVKMEIPKLDSHLIKNIDEFNQATDTISKLLFGSQDYALIAKR